MTGDSVYDSVAATAIYQSAAQLESCADRLFRRLQKEYPGALRRVLGQRTLIRLKCSDPETMI